MEYKIIKKIDEGYQTIIYLIEIKNKKYILKQYLILKEKLNYRKNYWNEILVCKFIDKLKKNKQNFVIVVASLNSKNFFIDLKLSCITPIWSSGTKPDCPAFFNHLLSLPPFLITSSNSICAGSTFKKNIFLQS